MKSNAAKVLVGIAIAGLCLAMFIAGAGFAIWFNQNFAIVPKAELVDSLTKSLQESENFKTLLGENRTISEEQLNALLSEETVKELVAGDKELDDILGKILEKGVDQKPAQNWAMNPKLREQQKNGAFTFKFTPGETLNYRLTAKMEGAGMEAIGGSPIDLNLDSAIALTTQSVDQKGYGQLRMQFGDTLAQGDFMGSPFLMARGDAGTRLEMNGQTYIDSAANQGSSAGIPQLEFFDHPIDMEVAPNGVVTAISGESGMGAILGAAPLFTDIEFPEGEITEGTSWTSHVTMPVPGIGTPIPTTIKNTFTGYKTVGNRLCAVIDQQITSEQVQGKLSAPASVLGAAIGFSMPKFELDGANKVYFDVENGQMVHSDLDLDLGIDIGQTLGGSGNQLNGLLQGLGNILGDLPEFEAYSDMLPKSENRTNSQMKNSNNLLEMNVDIKAQMSLTDPPTPH